MPVSLGRSSGPGSGASAMAAELGLTHGHQWAVVLLIPAGRVAGTGLVFGVLE